MSMWKGGSTSCDELLTYAIKRPYLITQMIGCLFRVWYTLVAASGTLQIGMVLTICGMNEVLWVSLSPTNVKVVTRVGTYARLFMEATSELGCFGLIILFLSMHIRRVKRTCLQHIEFLKLSLYTSYSVTWSTKATFSRQWLKTA